MKLSLCKLCQVADRLSSGNPILVGIFSRMQVGGWPARLDPCFLALEIETEPILAGHSIPFQIRFIDEDGRLLTDANLTLELGNPNEVFQQRTYVPLPIPWDDRIRFDQPGIFRFDVVAWPGTNEEQVLGGETLVVHG